MAIEEVIDEHKLRISPPAEATSSDDAYSIGRRLYGQFEVSNCHFFMIDARSHRDVPDFENPYRSDKSILGAEQLQWLKEGIAASTAEFIFVVSSVNFMIPHTEPSAAPGAIPKKGEAWTVFMHEREQLIELWDKMDKPIFLLTGDLHNSFAIQITDNVFEFASGPQIMLPIIRMPMETDGLLFHDPRWSFSIMMATRVSFGLRIRYRRWVRGGGDLYIFETKYTYSS